MKINTEQLRKFMQYAAAVRPNILYASLDSVLIESTGNEIRFTKTNNNVYCRYQYNAVAPIEQILVIERQLIGFLATTSAAEITIEQGIESVTITDGNPVHVPILDAATYPVMPAITTSGTTVLANVDKIKTAGKYIGHDKNNITARNYVNIDENGIFGTNGNLLYYYKCVMPRLLLDNDVLAFLANFDNSVVHYTNSGNYDFFICEGIICGFIRHEFALLPYAEFVIKQTGEKFVVAKQKLIDYCTRVIYSAKEEFPAAVLSGSLDLKYFDADFKIACDSKLPCEGAAEEAFKFSVLAFKEALLALPYENIVFTKFGPHYQTTTPEDENYVGLITGLGV